MKVSRIEIKDFQQFKDFELDLTYPEGHPKAGQPLDKVCFIGQSGTGKTTILNLIEQLNSFASGEHIIPYSIDKKSYCNISVTYAPSNAKKVAFMLPDDSTKYDILEDLKGNTLTIKEFYNNLNLGNYDRDIRILYFKFGTNFSVEYKNYKKEEFYLQENPKKIWDRFEKQIREYTNEISKYRIAISKAFEKGNTEEAEKSRQALVEWEKENKNPIIKITEEVLNPLLKKFGLFTKTEVDSLEEANFINICAINNKKNIPIHGWSTGTLQVVLKLVALYNYKPQQSFILVDEIENSLFPDTQREIINHYIEAAPESQFFFATHSPIIASQFEPCEIVELKFDENGNVYREDYLKKGMPRHVDNYKFYPEYLRWDEVLTRVFDLESEGNKREEILSMALYYQAKIEKMKEKGQNNGAEFENLMQEYQKLAHKLGWIVYEKNS